MNTEPTNPAARGTPQSSGGAGAGEAAIGFAVLGLFAAGISGIMRAWSATDLLDAAACLAASVTAFGTICYFVLRRM
jgi:hypothetical protein